MATYNPAMGAMEQERQNMLNSPRKIEELFNGVQGDECNLGGLPEGDFGSNFTNSIAQVLQDTASNDEMFPMKADAENHRFSRMTTPGPSSQAVTSVPTADSVSNLPNAANKSPKVPAEATTTTVIMEESSIPQESDCKINDIHINDRLHSKQRLDLSQIIISTTYTAESDGDAKYLSTVARGFHTKTGILVMGGTGSGKSTFIREVTGNQDVRVGHGLESSTQTTYPYSGNVSGRECFFIDTPSFDDSRKSQATVLANIAAALDNLYSNKIDISGIVYLHRISDMRMSGSALQNLRIFKALCGDRCFHNVVIGITHWPRHTDGTRYEELANERLKLLIYGYWWELINNGARVWIVDQNANGLAKILVSKTPQVLQFQEERSNQLRLHGHHLSITLTQAGKELDSMYEEKKSRLKKEEERVKETYMKATVDQSNADQVAELDRIRKELKHIRSSLKRVQKEQNTLQKAGTGSVNFRVFSDALGKIFKLGKALVSIRSDHHEGRQSPSL